MFHSPRPPRVGPTGRRVKPPRVNDLGVKGAGEAGTLPVTAAVANAVEDALWPLGARVTRLPLNPARISALIHGT
ncbi:MAG TPA: hypothetical protein VMS64_13635 [Candidatus Methylomirabilis sp.]|nr:hypothetical protein [Candidatus Methylomirabilis sp.]